MNENGLFIGDFNFKPVVVSSNEETNKNHLVVGIIGKGMGMSFYQKCMLEDALKNGETVLIIDPKSDYKNFVERRTL